MKVKRRIITTSCFYYSYTSLITFSISHCHIVNSLLNSYSCHVCKVIQLFTHKYTTVPLCHQSQSTLSIVKNWVCAQTRCTGKKVRYKEGSLASLAVHKPCRSWFIACKRVCIHCNQVNILRLQDTLKPLSPSLHLATFTVKAACMCIHWSKDGVRPSAQHVEGRLLSAPMVWICGHAVRVCIYIMTQRGSADKSGWNEHMKGICCLCWVLDNGTQEKRYMWNVISACVHT